MKLVPRGPKQVMWLVAPAFIALLAVAQRQPPSVPRTSVGDSLPMCPHYWGDYIQARGGYTLLNPDEISVARSITNVPEFHDCQRFVVFRNGRPQYDALFAIFGAWDLEVRWDSIAADTLQIDLLPLISVDSVRGSLAASAYPDLGLTLATGRLAESASHFPTSG